MDTQVSEELVERVAKAICAHGVVRLEWEKRSEHQKECFRADAKAAIAAMPRTTSGDGELVEALEQCKALFREIRNDWYDPRAQCREGIEILDGILSRAKP